MVMNHLQNGMILQAAMSFLSNEKRAPGFFRGFVGDEILPSYVGIIS